MTTAEVTRGGCDTTAPHAPRRAIARQVELHSLPLLYFGYGALGGLGWGLMYLSPVSTVMKWFPDRRGMATGITLSAFGVGAAVAPPVIEAGGGRHTSSHLTTAMPTSHLARTTWRVRVSLLRTAKPPRGVNTPSLACTLRAPC